MASAMRVFNLIDEPVDIRDNPDSKDIGQVQGSIAFNNIDFAYKNGTPILENFNLNIEKGSFVGIVGPTGSGKSTLIKCFCVFTIL